MGIRLRVSPVTSLPLNAPPLQGAISLWLLDGSQRFQRLRLHPSGWHGLGKDIAATWLGFRLKKNTTGISVLFWVVCLVEIFRMESRIWIFSGFQRLKKDIWNRETVSGAISGYYLGGGLKYFLFSSLFGEMIQFYRYCSNGLKPPTSYSLSFLGGSMRSSCG